MQRNQFWRYATYVAVFATATVCFATAIRAETSAPVKAVWNVQELRLTYMGFTSLYSCDGMRERVAEWVKQIGASNNSYVRLGGCDRPSGPAHMPSVRIYLATPVPANSEAAAANAKDPKRAETIATMEKYGKAPLQDSPFDAVSKNVVLPSKPRIVESAQGDCELLENFRDQVLKKIGARVINDQLGCIPHQGTVGNPTLKVEVLTKAPA